ncbi:hypothetical protein COCMIDRAFT_29005 [Bipolaris oryzae ATCC 44560]|uniref:Uncharacterized protein n=1 Tax=Bipolaris oryzae ATCC 44560 TaxID=930090 RepID=W6YSC7_COCMI|nr:uncharacterized protein COCMIDRAFT_29005 [Bipolaris oryzae ATCC 44560]EUC42352.1 hypothetical protein COCMIDRAFT_29005 [Bipolaris oryzae ATCC 44560]
MPRRLRAPAMFEVYFPAQSRCWYGRGQGRENAVRQRRSTVEQDCPMLLLHPVAGLNTYKCVKMGVVYSVLYQDVAWCCKSGSPRRASISVRWQRGEWITMAAYLGAGAARAVVVAVALSSPPMPLCCTAWPCQARPGNVMQVNKSNTTTTTTMAAAATSMNAVQCSAVSTIAILV